MDDISFLLNNGVPLEEIQKHLSDGLPMEQLVSAAQDLVARGEPITTPEKDLRTVEKKQLRMISAPDLQKATLPPLRFIMEDILPEGTSLISAASKIGKSWMVLDLGLCVAAGEPFMGHRTNQSGVLYAREAEYQT